MNILCGKNQMKNVNPRWYRDDPEFFFLLRNGPDLGDSFDNMNYVFVDAIIKSADKMDVTLLITFCSAIGIGSVVATVCLIVGIRKILQDRNTIANLFTSEKNTGKFPPPIHNSETFSFSSNPTERNREYT